jgi:hypothetical protein
MALNDVHADRYFGRYRGKNGHTATTREPTRLTHHVISPSSIGALRKALADHLVDHGLQNTGNNPRPSILWRVR